MLNSKQFITCLLSLFLFTNLYPQSEYSQKPSWTATLEYKYVPSISDQIKDGTFVPADEDAHKKLGREKRWHGNKVVPGKGLPNGDDPLLYLQENVITKSSRDPILTFETTSNTATPSDPTGEMGRDYYFASWNSSLISGQDMEAAMKAFMEKSKANYDDLEPTHSFWEKDGLVP